MTSACFIWYQAREDCKTKGMSFEELKASGNKIDLENDYMEVCECVSIMVDMKVNYKRHDYHQSKEYIDNALKTISIKLSDNIHTINNSASVNPMPTNAREGCHALGKSDIINLWGTAKYYYCNRDVIDGIEWIELNEFDDMIFEDSVSTLEARDRLQKFYDNDGLGDIYTTEYIEEDHLDEVFDAYDNEFIKECLNSYDFCSTVAYDVERELKKIEGTPDTATIEKLWNKAIDDNVTHNLDYFVREYYHRNIYYED